MKFNGSCSNCGSDYYGVHLAPVYFINNSNIELKKVNFIQGPNENSFDNIIKQYNKIQYDDKNFLFGGDHTVSIGSTQESRADSLIWLDAHGDYNTEVTSPSGNYHGMALSMILNNFNRNLEWIDNNIKEENCNIIGVRNLDKKEKERLEKSNINVKSTMECKNTDDKDSLFDIGNKVHLSIDLDVLDPSYAPGVDVSEEEGLNIVEFNQLLVHILNNYNVSSIDIVEYNPLKDTGHRTLNSIGSIVENIISNWG